MRVSWRLGRLGLLVVVGVIAGCAPATVTPPIIGSTTTTAVPTTTVAGTATTVMVVAAGDIACSPVDKYFNGGLGDATHCQMKATADLAAVLKPATVLPLGDLQYEAGTVAEFQGAYDLSWGRFKTISRPVPGNHEYLTTEAAGYRTYFGTAAAPAGTTWYSFDLGSWHIVALDANCNKIGGCGPSSPEGTWLAADLANSPAECTLAMWHQPAFSSSQLGGVANVLPLWQAVVQGGAEVVLNGHRHLYERFSPMDAAGAVAAATGTREIVVGTGGEDLESFGAIKPTSEARAQSFGVLQLQLGSAGYTFRFVDINGTTLDQGSGTCHGKP